MASLELPPRLPLPLRGARQVPTAPKSGPAAPSASGAKSAIGTTTAGNLPTHFVLTPRHSAHERMLRYVLSATP
eukprot:scaffold99050_cov51-Phaeocystis_antarctica.AAC.1